ncbi:hypothetical protein B0H63DRAFT_364385, partial [Podospora didyma]
VAAFYFNARGNALERTPEGLFRSIIHQMCVQDRGILRELYKLHNERAKVAAALGTDAVVWTRNELEIFLRRTFQHKHQSRPQRTFFLIDALDEYDEKTVRGVVYLFAELGKSALAKSIDLSICLSSRHYPTITIPDCPEIVVEDGNRSDISVYVGGRFTGLIPTSEASVVADLESSIVEQSSGVFLWVALVVDLLLRDIDSGQPIGAIRQRLRHVPKRMEDLYAELLQGFEPTERQFSARLVEWVLLGSGNKDIHDVFLAVLFSGPELAVVMDSLRWKDASRGLLEYTSGTVQFIHETVRELFFSGPRLSILDDLPTVNP